MPIFNNILAGSSGQGDTGYNIDQSLRFENGDSAYLSRENPKNATSNRIGTISFWTKRGNLGGGNAFFSGHESGNQRTYIGFDADKIQMFGKTFGDVTVELVTTQVFRDPSAWYHILIAVDVTQATASNRVKFYVNGSQITNFSTSDYPPHNEDLPMFSKEFHQVGAFYSTSIGDYFDGLLSEFHYVDGSTLTPATFGETSSAHGQWIPKDTTDEITYGNQGFYLKFQDASALGDDSSGNTNDFTANNLVATDQVPDSPSNSFATFNNVLADKQQCGSVTFREGNLEAETNYVNSDYQRYPIAVSTIAQESGKWYAEFLVLKAAGASTVEGGPGVVSMYNLPWLHSTSPYIGSSPSSCGYMRRGELRGFGQDTSGYAAFSENDIISVAMDLDNLKCYWAKNNTWITIGGSVGDPTSGSSGTGALSMSAIATSGPYAFAIGNDNATDCRYRANFGQDSSFAGNKTAQGNGGVGEDFYYTPPTGYKALNTNNLNNPSIANPTAHFDTTLVSGNGSNRSITGLNFQPDFLWGKSRTNTLNHYLTDSIRGVNSQVYSDTFGSQGSESVIYTAFNSDGFSLGTGDMNLSGQNYVHWGWKGGGTAVSNTDGSVTSSVSANTTAGMSVVTWTNNNVTVGHGLSQAPELIMMKNREAAASWLVYSSPVGNAHTLFLNTTDQQDAGSGYFNSTSPTASVFSVGTTGGALTDDFVAYCFHSVEGYSKVGSYTGNGSADGIFIYTGFMPEWLLVKQVNAVGNWLIWDVKRSEFNVMNDYLVPNENREERENTAVNVDFVSNGFKWRNSDDDMNGSGDTYIYLAFAKSPFKYSNAR